MEQIIALILVSSPFVMMIIFYYMMVIYTRNKLEYKCTSINLFLACLKKQILMSKEVSFVGVQKGNSYFFELKNQRNEPNVYRIKIGGSSISFSRVLFNAWYRNPFIEDFHTSTVAVVDYRKFYDTNPFAITNSMDIGTTLFSKSRKVKAEADRLERKLFRVKEMVERMGLQYRQLNGHVSYSEIKDGYVTDRDFLEFVKNDFDEAID